MVAAFLLLNNRPVGWPKKDKVMTKITLRTFAEIDDNDPLCCSNTCKSFCINVQARNQISCRGTKLESNSEGKFLRTQECLEQQVKPEVIDSLTLVSDKELAYQVAFSSIVTAAGPVDVFEKYSLRSEDKNIHLEFYLNGIQADILPFFARVEDNFDRQVNKVAADLVMEKFGDVTDSLYRIKQSIIENFPGVEED